MNTTDIVTKKFSLNSSITYSHLNGTWEWNNCIVTPSWYRDYLYPACHSTYTLNYGRPEISFIETAFRVAKMLQEKELVNLRTIRQFVDFIDELIEVL